MGDSNEQPTRRTRHGQQWGFLAGLALAGAAAFFSGITGETDPVMPEAPAPVTAPTLDPVAPQTEPAPISFERAAARTALERCAQRSMDASPLITPPAGAVPLAAANFPGDLGFGPVVIHLPLPGSAFLHVLRSDSPLPSTGAVDPFAAPLVVDAEITQTLGAESIAVGISAPFRSAFPAGWLPRFIELLTGCLSASAPSTGTATPASPTTPSTGSPALPPLQR